MSDRPHKLLVPNFYASGYYLDLYCDHASAEHGWNAFPHVYTGETFAACAKQARDDGWAIHPSTRTATCPQCVRAVTPPEDKHDG